MYEHPHEITDSTIPTRIMTSPIADWRFDRSSSSTLEVFLLGTVDFASALGLQARLRDQLATRVDTHGILLLCEHPPTISIGREGSFADVLVEREELVSRKMDVHWVNRGGGVFVHGSGQVAVYPLLPLDRLKLGLLDFRSRLEQTLLRAAEDLDVEATRSANAPGAECRCGQFAFIGAGVRSWVTHGGMVVNVSIAQECLDLVRWTHSPTRITTLEAQRMKPTSMASVRETLIRRLAQSFGYDDYQLHTGHPLLQRTTRKVYVFG